MAETKPDAGLFLERVKKKFNGILSRRGSLIYRCGPGFRTVRGFRCGSFMGNSMVNGVPLLDWGTVLR